MPRTTTNLQRSVVSAFADLRRQYRADYDAARPSRFRRERSGLGGTADAHYANETAFNRLREAVRDMDRNDSILGSTVNKCVQQMVQGGFRLDPATGDKGLNLELWHRFDEWASDPDRCDLAGELTFADMESLVARHEIVDGDIFALPTEDGTLQLVEADRLRTPTNSRRNIVHGIELDAFRRRLGYYITREVMDPNRRVQRVSDTVRVAARDEDGHRQVIHVYHPERCSQTRGVTAFHAIFDVAGMREDTEFALVVKQQVAACFGTFLERSGDFQATPGTDLSPFGGMPAGEYNTDDIDELSPGLMLKGRPGEKLLAFSPNIPSSETMAHLKHLLQVIGLNLGMPLALVLMDPSGMNFSGWRGAYDQAKLGFRYNQHRLIRHFHKPVYQWKVRQFAERDRTLRRHLDRLGDKSSWHTWTPPAWPYVKPLEDAEADAKRINNLLSSPRRVVAERGLDWDDLVDETVADNARLILKSIRAAQRLTRRTGVQVHYRDVMNREVYRGGQVIDTIELENAMSASNTEETP